MEIIKCRTNRNKNNYIKKKNRIVFLILIIPTKLL